MANKNPHKTEEQKRIVIFDDRFEKSGLGPDWLISPGRGSYSLADKPGRLRYIIDADHTARVAGSGQNYAKALWLVRPFLGKRWILETDVIYKLRPGAPTNNRNMHFIIRAPGANGKIMARVDRSIGINDNNRGSNALSLSAGNNEKTVYFPNSPHPLPAEKWHIEMERDDNRVSVKAVREGGGSKFEYACEHRFSPGGFGNKQEIEIEGDGWHGSNNPPGYVDFDFIRATEISTITLENISVRYIEGVGEARARKLEAHEILTVEDMALADIVTLGKKTGISVFALYAWKKRAALVVDFRIKRSLFANILKMRLDEVMIMPDNELSKKAKQPVKVILNLKMSIATLLVSLDNAAVMPMTIGSVAVDI